MIDAGLTVTALREHRESEWQALAHMVEGADGKFRLPGAPTGSRSMFTLEARGLVPTSVARRCGARR